LIEDLLDDARSKNPDIEWAFSTDSAMEPVFVKNLETVQGDERDVILFSITYGPDQSGHLTMNFGPLNREGGERRLNVAMTRARSEMIVFSTLSPDRIDLSRSQARAVADLKHFLEYAERGPSALGSAVFGSTGDFESPFEAAVTSALRDKGWEVHPQVGVSAYRIDLGIVHPDQPGVYLAGIECDGAMYHSSAFARERDKIRQSVLKDLGWTLFRVWSTDWWTNRSKALETMDLALQSQLTEDRQRRKETAQASESPQTTSNEMPNGNPIETYAGPTSTPVISKMESPPQPNSKENTYLITNFDGGDYRADPERFYSEEYKPQLSAMIDHVIDTEGPIHEDILVRRIARHHGFQRAGRQIRDTVLTLAKLRREQTEEDVGLFFWKKGAVKDYDTHARYLSRNDEMRNPEHICKEELYAIKELLGSGGPIELARSLGIARLSPTAYRRIEESIKGLRKL